MISRYLFLLAWIGLFLPDGMSQALDRNYDPSWNFSPEARDVIEKRRRLLLWGPTTKIENRNAKLHFVNFTLAKSDFLRSLDSLELLMSADPMTTLLNDVKDHIVQHNASLSGTEFAIYMYRSEEANAFSVGEGVILFSTALLERVPTVEHAAFIIAHEMAHEIRKHVFEGAVKYSNSLYNEELVKEVRKVGRRAINRMSNIQNLIDGFVSEHLQFTREMELEADSIGFALIANAGFSSEAALVMLDQMTTNDQFAYTDSLRLDSIFDFAAFPFRSHWTQTDSEGPGWKIDSSFYFPPDSMMSHPQLVLRSQHLRAHPMFGQAFTHSFSSAETYRMLLGTIPFESIAGYIQTENYGAALFNALQLLDRYPENVYLHAAVANCLLELGNALLDGSFLDKVPFPSINQDGAYNHLLYFLHTLHSTDYKALYREYYKQHLAGITDRYTAYLHIIEAETLTADAISAYSGTYASPYFGYLLENRLKRLNQPVK